MTALLLDVADAWPLPLATAAMVPLLLFAAWRGATRWSFVTFLLVSTGYILWRFPDVANHVNLQLYVNAALLIALSVPARWLDHSGAMDRFNVIRPVVQVAAVLTYVLAGFHKLNRDFFNPDVSCARPFLEGFLVVAGSPIILMAALAAIIIAADAAWHRMPARPGSRRILAAALAAAALLGAATFLLPSELLWDRLRQSDRFLISGMAGAVVAWELGGGLLLAVPRFQFPVVAFSWIMHAAFSFVGFIDFGATALALLLAFLPDHYFALLDRAPLRVGGRALRRIHLYVFLNLLTVVLTPIPFVKAFLDHHIFQGLIHNGTTLILIWPIIHELATRRLGLAWRGFSIAAALRRPALLAFALLLLFHGLSGYLGMRTAGNFSMFSNLRTEGARSNHLLLGDNPLKIWSYQEDVVKILRLDQNIWIGHNSGPLEGNALPIVEFRKLVHLWTKANMTVPITFSYRGTVHTSSDIVRDPVWAAHERSWAMRLMDFRIIQEDGPNRCRW